MNRRDFLQATGAVTLGSLIGAATPQDIPSNEEAPAWAPTWLPALKEALGIEGDTERIHLKFDTGMFAIAIIYRGDYSPGEHLILPVWGIVEIKEALGLPHIAQHVQIEIVQDNWVTVYYRMTPKNVSINALIDVLKDGAVS